MKFSLPTILLKNGKTVAALAIIISVATWWMDFAGLVYECPYCRTQRTVIGVLGVIMLLPFVHHWITKIIAIEIGGFGFIVGALQHFRGWVSIWEDKFVLNATAWTDPTILSAVSMFIILLLVFVILGQSKIS